jgi:hypothetical protein
MPGTSQELIWTALPNGTVPGHPKTLRLSVFVSPRLSTSAGPPRPELHLFPDFLDWPATHISWKVTIGGKYAAGLKVVSPAPRSELWKALFHKATYVEPYTSQSLNGRQFHSYPAWYVRQFHASTYALYAQSSTEWPTIETLFREGPDKHAAPYGKIPFNTDLEQEAINEIESLYANAIHGALAPSAQANPRTDLTQAKLFLQPLTVPKDPKYHDLKPTPKPTIDFHRMISTLGEYPHLLRLFGLVYDLEVTLPTGLLLPAVQVGVTPSWTPLLKPVAATTNFVPTTGATLPDFLPQPRTPSPEIFRGVLRLSDAVAGGQPAYPVIELEMDGSTLKTLNFAQSVARTFGQSAETTPQSWALPALRSAGLALAHTGQALDFGQAMSDLDTMNTAVANSDPVVLAAEDVTRGFRIDVWDSHTDKWHQLCARTAAPSPGGYAIGKAPNIEIVPVPAGDEGWVALSVADGPQGGPNNTYLPETLLRWANWSLVAPRPGKHLSDVPSDGLESDQNNPPETAFPLRVAYAATPGTLPVLRYGRSYRFRARAVDLAGNSVAFSSAPTAFSFHWGTKPLRYGRLEPVVSPPLIPHDPRTVGEHLERLVIRSEFWNSPDSAAIASSRHVVPPSTTEEMAEAHGIADLPAGGPDPAKYSVLAPRAGLTYATASVLASLGGKPDQLDQPYYPVDNLEVPYLPDVIARGALLRGLPGSPVPVDVSFANEPGTWPVSKSFRLVIKGGTGAPVKPTVANGRTLTVFAPKATFATVRLSCFLTGADLESMGLWEWLEEQGFATPALAAIARSGRHYMFTPYRELVIVHAVRQPLTPPQFTKPHISRGYGKTFALLVDKIEVDGKSSIKLDILSRWQEPFDDGVNPAGSVEIAHSAPVGAIPLGTAVPPPTSVATPAPGLRHDFGDTKHREVFYEAQATTRFLEYFVQTHKVTLHGTAPAVVHAGGLATGATTVKSIGTPAITFQPTVDYVEDDTTGTIARTATSAIALHNGVAHVEVSFVPPPVIRSSLEKVVAPAKPTGYPLSVPSSARPGAPDVRYILPLFAFGTASSSAEVKSLRLGNAVRVYLGRPWWSSGAGELLGVVVYPVPAGVPATVYPPTLEPFVTRYGRDPLRVTNAVRVPTSKDFALATRIGTNISLVEAESTGPPPVLVDVVGHEVGFDTDHQLWYCDIEINTSALPPTGAPTPFFSYWPFVRLGLVRYQPASLRGVEVSRVVQADFVQIAPNRLATLTFPSPTEVRVTVAGVGYVTGPVQGLGPVTATVEEEIPGVTDPDLKWVAVAKSTVTLVPKMATGEEVTWTAVLLLPAIRGSRPFRIRIEEAELYVGPGGTLAPVYVPRVTYIETLQI